ncbi:MAG: sulfur oxidation c-type cytochrome SoxX [Hyphomicrobiaceae bacterium]
MNKVGAAVVAGCASLVLVTASASADVVKPAAVKIKEGELAQSLTGKKGDPVAGKKTFVGRKLGNCLACHVNKDTSDQQFHGEVGPPLDGVAERHEPAALRAIIVDSKAVFGDQTLMPAFYREAGLNRVHKKFKGKTILSAQQVEDVLAYLLTLKE